MKKKFLSKNIAILGLSYLGVDYAYASSACMQNDANPPVFVCSGVDNQNHFFPSQDGNLVSVILNNDYFNTINESQPVFNINSNTGVSFEQKKGSELKNLSGDALNSENHVASGNAITEVKISGNINSGNGRAINIDNQGATASTSLDIDGNVTAENGAAIYVINSILDSVDPENSSSSTNLSVNITETANIMSLQGIHLDNTGISSAYMRIDIAGKITSDYGHFYIQNTAHRGDATLSLNIRENAKIISTESGSSDGISVSNTSTNGKSSVLLSVEGQLNQTIKQLNYKIFQVVSSQRVPLI